MPQSTTITLDSKHLEFVEHAAKAAGISVDDWINNLINLSRRAIPQLCIMAGLKMQEVSHADN